MTVYLAEQCEQYGNSYILGAFSSLENAKQFKAEQARDLRSDETIIITPYVVDARRPSDIGE